MSVTALQNRIDKLSCEYIQTLVLICHSYENEAEQITDCLKKHGREPDHIIRILAAHKNHDTGELFYTYGGEVYQDG